MVKDNLLVAIHLVISPALACLFLTAALLTFSLPSNGQQSKYSLSLEYSSYLSNFIGSEFKYDNKFSQHGFVKVEYMKNHKFRPTIGIGILNTGDRVTSIGVPPEIESFLFISNYNYLVIPFGARFFKGKFYMYPEFGVGLNLSKKVKFITYLTDGSKKVTSYDEVFPDNTFNRITIPVFLSTGWKFDIGRVSLLTGLKGYFGANSYVRNAVKSIHFYGIGLSVGLRFGN